MQALFDAAQPSWLSLAGCVVLDFGLDIAKYAYVGGQDDDPKAPVAVGPNSTTTPMTTPTPIRYLIPLGVVTVVIGVALLAIGWAFIPMTLLIPILAVRFTTSLIFSWIVIGIAPSPAARAGAACYGTGLLALLLEVSGREVVLLDSDQFLALCTATPYTVCLVMSLGAVVASLLLPRFASSTRNGNALKVAVSVVLGSHAPALVKQLSAIVASAFLHRTLRDVARLQSAVIIALAAASYWFYDRRLRDSPARAVDGVENDLLRLHLGFNIIALVNGVVLFQEYKQWRWMTVTSLGLVFAGIAVLARETFASAGDKGEVETTARRSSWKEISRVSTGRGSEILRLGQPPAALALPVRNMAQIVFAPASPSAGIPKKSVLMVADCRHQARKSVKGVVVDLESERPLPSPK